MSRFYLKISEKFMPLILSLLLFDSFESFSHQRLLMVSPWGLSCSMSPQVSRTLLNILVDPNNAVIWMVSTRLLISKSSSLSTNHLVTVLRVPVTIGITVTFMFHGCFFFSRSLARYRYISLFYLASSFTLWLAGTRKSTIRQFLFFMLNVARSSYLDYPLVSQNLKAFCASRFLGRILDCADTICSYGQI